MNDFYEDPGWRHKMNAEALKYLDKKADEILADAKANTPIDTGDLVESMKAVSHDGTARIGSNLNYSLYVEEGHRAVFKDAEGKKHWSGSVVPGRYMLQKALYKKRSD